MFKFYRKLIKDGRTWELQKKAIFSRRSLLLFLSKFLKLEERMHDIGTECLIEEMYLCLDSTFECLD